MTISMEGKQTLRIQDTGIGLYRGRRIRDNLGRTITVHSAVDVGMAIDIDLSREKPEIE